MTVEIKESDFRNLYINTRNIDKKILANMKKNLKKAAQPAVADVKTEIGGIHFEHKNEFANAPRPKIGLRESLIRSLKISFRSTKKQSGVFILVDGKMFANISQRFGAYGGSRSKLPKYVEGRITRWKHPVFGHNKNKPSKWPTQKASPFFDETIIKHKPDFIKGVNKAVEEAFAEIEKKGLL